MLLDELRTHITQIPGLGRFPIRDHDHLAKLLGSKDDYFKFLDNDLTMDDIRRMFPANYFPIESEDDLMTKVVTLMQIGPNGFQEATDRLPVYENAPLPADVTTQDHGSQPHDCAGYEKEVRPPTRKGANRS